MYEYQQSQRPQPQPSTNTRMNNKYNTNLSSHPYYSSPTYDEIPPSIMQFGRDDLDFLNAPPTSASGSVASSIHPKNTAQTTEPSSTGAAAIPTSSPSYFATNFPDFQEQDSITQKLNQYRELEQSINGTLANIKENSPSTPPSFPNNNVQSNFDFYKAQPQYNQGGIGGGGGHPLTPPLSFDHHYDRQPKDPIQSPSQTEEYSKLQRDFASLLEQHQKLLISKEEIENRLKEKISLLSQKISNLERSNSTYGGGTSSISSSASSDWLREKEQYERRIKVMQRQYDAKISDLVHQFEREKGASLGILRERMRAEVGLLIPRIKESCKRHYQRISKESIDGLSFRLKNQYESLIAKIRSQNRAELRLRDDEWRCRLKDERDQIIRQAEAKWNDKLNRLRMQKFSTGSYGNYSNSNNIYSNNNNNHRTSSTNSRHPLESLSGNYFDQNSFF